MKLVAKYHGFSDFMSNVNNFRLARNTKETRLYTELSAHKVHRLLSSVISILKFWLLLFLTAPLTPCPDKERV